MSRDYMQRAFDRPSPGGTSAPASALYLELMKRVLTNAIYRDMSDLTRNRDLRDQGHPWRRDFIADWREPCHTMASFKRLDSAQFCVEDVIARQVPGDLIETGVWRGGVSILMRAVLEVHGVRDRRVWVADSFAGLPPPSRTEDRDHDLSQLSELAVSLDQVKSHFDRYGLLDDQVRFLPGWFCDTLPTAPIDRLAVLRLDGDLYQSTIDALTYLYPKLSIGGWVIVDDYGALLPCRQAVHDYRAANAIEDPIVAIDWTEVRWQRSGRDRATRPSGETTGPTSAG